MIARSESGQALVETIFVIPACVMCALGLVGIGTVIRDRIAVEQAGTRAGVAAEAGGDPVAAARAGMPAAMRAHAHIDRAGDDITVRATSHLPVPGLRAAIPVSAHVRVDGNGGQAS